MIVEDAFEGLVYSDLDVVGWVFLQFLVRIGVSEVFHA